MADDPSAVRRTRPAAPPPPPPTMPPVSTTIKGANTFRAQPAAQASRFGYAAPTKSSTAASLNVSGATFAFQQRSATATAARTSSFGRIPTSTTTTASSTTGSALDVKPRPSSAENTRLRQKPTTTSSVASAPKSSTDFFSMSALGLDNTQAPPLPPPRSSPTPTPAPTAFTATYTTVSSFGASTTSSVASKPAGQLFSMDDSGGEDDWGVDSPGILSPGSDTATAAAAKEKTFEEEEFGWVDESETTQQPASSPAPIPVPAASPVPPPSASPLPAPASSPFPVPASSPFSAPESSPFRAPASSPFPASAPSSFPVAAPPAAVASATDGWGGDFDFNDDALGGGADESGWNDEFGGRLSVVDSDPGDIAPVVTAAPVIETVPAPVLATPAPTSQTPPKSTTSAIDLGAVLSPTAAPAGEFWGDEGDDVLFSDEEQPTVDEVAEVSVSHTTTTLEVSHISVTTTTTVQETQSLNDEFSYQEDSKTTTNEVVDATTEFNDEWDEFEGGEALPDVDVESPVQVEAYDEVSYSSSVDVGQGEPSIDDIPTLAEPDEPAQDDVPVAEFKYVEDATRQTTEENVAAVDVVFEHDASQLTHPAAEDAAQSIDEHPTGQAELFANDQDAEYSSQFAEHQYSIQNGEQPAEVAQFDHVHSQSVGQSDAAAHYHVEHTEEGVVPATHQFLEHSEHSHEAVTNDDLSSHFGYHNQSSDYYSGEQSVEYTHQHQYEHHDQSYAIGYTPQDFGIAAQNDFSHEDHFASTQPVDSQIQQSSNEELREQVQWADQADLTAVDSQSSEHQLTESFDPTPSVTKPEVSFGTSSFHAAELAFGHYAYDQHHHHRTPSEADVGSVTSSFAEASSAGATFGGSDVLSESAYSDGDFVSDTRSIHGSSSAGTAFITEPPSSSDGQASNDENDDAGTYDHRSDASSAFGAGGGAFSSEFDVSSTKSALFEHEVSSTGFDQGDDGYNYSEQTLEHQYGSYQNEYAQHTHDFGESVPPPFENASVSHHFESTHSTNEFEEAAESSHETAAAHYSVPSSQDVPTASELEFQHSDAENIFAASTATATSSAFGSPPQDAYANHSGSTSNFDVRDHAAHSASEVSNLASGSAETAAEAELTFGSAGEDEANPFASSTEAAGFASAPAVSFPPSSESESTAGNEFVPSAASLFGGSPDKVVSTSPFSSFAPPPVTRVDAAPTPVTVEEVPTADAGELFADTPPVTAFGGGFQQPHSAVSTAEFFGSPRASAPFDQGYGSPPQQYGYETVSHSAAAADVFGASSHSDYEGHGNVSADSFFGGGSATASSATDVFHSSETVGHQEFDGSTTEQHYGYDGYSSQYDAQYNAHYDGAANSEVHGQSAQSFFGHSAATEGFESSQGGFSTGEQNDWAVSHEYNSAPHEVQSSESVFATSTSTVDASGFFGGNVSASAEDPQGAFGVAESVSDEFPRNDALPSTATEDHHRPSTYEDMSNTYEEDKHAVEHQEQAEAKDTSTIAQNYDVNNSSYSKDTEHREVEGASTHFGVVADDSTLETDTSALFGGSSGSNGFGGGVSGFFSSGSSQHQFNEHSYGQHQDHDYAATQQQYPGYDGGAFAHQGHDNASYHGFGAHTAHHTASAHTFAASAESHHDAQAQFNHQPVGYGGGYEETNTHLPPQQYSNESVPHAPGFNAPAPPDRPQYGASFHAPPVQEASSAPPQRSYPAAHPSYPGDNRAQSSYQTPKHDARSAPSTPGFDPSPLRLPEPKPSLHEPAPPAPQNVYEPYGRKSSTPMAAHATATVPLTSSKHKDPTMVVPSCLASFGFGGNVVTMFPKQKLRLTGAAFGARNSPRTPMSMQFENTPQGELRKGPVSVYRMEHLHPRNADFDDLDKFPGPLNENITEETLLQFVDEKMNASTGDSPFEEDERLLLGVLKVLIKCNGKLRSDATANPSDPASPEVQLVSLLKESDQRRRRNRPSSFPPPKPVQYPSHPDAAARNGSRVRELLLLGDRKAAVDVAIQAQMWPEAMLIASFTDKDEYKRALCAYFTSHYSAGDPCRALYLSFADQQEKSVHEPQKLHQQGNEDSSRVILSSWVVHVQMLLANRTADTNKILIELGDRLWKEAGAVVAAHTCYLLAGNSVEAPSPNSKIALLGADHKAPEEARFYVSPAAVQRTEMYEWVQRKVNPSATNMIPFQGYKLIYAMHLADHGKLETAFKYVNSMLTVIRSITSTMKPGTSMYLEGMQNQLVVLDDRLRQHLGSARADSVAAAASAKQGKWGLGSALSIMGKIVNRVVEGNDAPSQTAAPPSANGSLFQGAPKSTSAAAATPEYPSAAAIGYPAAASGPPGSGRGPAPIPSQPPAPFVSASRPQSARTLGSSQAPVPAAPTPLSGNGYGNQAPLSGNGYGTQTPLSGNGYGAQAPRSGSGYGSQPPLSGDGYGAPPTQPGTGFGAPPPGAGPNGFQNAPPQPASFPPAPQPAAPAPFQKPSLDLSGDAGKSGFDKPPSPGRRSADILKPKSPRSPRASGDGPGSDKGSASPKFKDQAKKGGRSKTPPPSRSSSGWLTGLSTFIATKINTSMNPEAKVAKLGEQMEAYFDEEKKRWVFPGETETEEVKMPSAPPTGPLPGSVPSSSSGGPPGGPPGTHSAPGSMAGGAPSDDPLAALMAPPQSRAHAALMKKDPVAAMMAPPQRPGYGARASTMPAKRPPPRPQFAVFKPAPGPTTSAASSNDQGPPSSDDAPPPGSQ